MTLRARATSSCSEGSETRGSWQSSSAETCGIEHSAPTTPASLSMSQPRVLTPRSSGHAHASARRASSPTRQPQMARRSSRCRPAAKARTLRSVTPEPFHEQSSSRSSRQPWLMLSNAVSERRQCANMSLCRAGQTRASEMTPASRSRVQNDRSSSTSEAPQLAPMRPRPRSVRRELPRCTVVQPLAKSGNRSSESGCDLSASSSRRASDLAAGLRAEIASGDSVIAVVQRALVNASGISTRRAVGIKRCRPDLHSMVDRMDDCMTLCLVCNGKVETQGQETRPTGRLTGAA